MTTHGAYEHLMAESDHPSAHAERWWTETARRAREAADELDQLRRSLPEHWRAGHGKDIVETVLRRLVDHLDEAYEAHLRIAETLAVRAEGLARARRLAQEAATEAGFAGLLVTPDGVVTPRSEPASMPVRVLANQLTARIAEALAHADTVRTRTAESLAAVPPPR